MSKVTVVGAGNVGATCANVIATREIADELVLLDIKEGVSEGKMLDIFQTATLMDFDTKLTGVTNDYAATADSDVVVVTSGMPRKPGMTREELIGVNAGIVASVVGNVLKYSPKAVILMISNPMDTMTYLALKKSGLPKNQIFGMGGALDSARFKCYLSKALKANSNEIEGMVIGGHGDTTMIPLYSKATYKGIPVTELLSKEEVEKVVADTMVGGATLTKLLGTSAWYAPGAAAAYVVESIIRDQKEGGAVVHVSGRRVRSERHLHRRSGRDRPGRRREGADAEPDGRREGAVRKERRGRSQDQQHPARDQGALRTPDRNKAGRGISLRPAFLCKGGGES